MDSVVIGRGGEVEEIHTYCLHYIYINKIFITKLANNDIVKQGIK